MNFEVPHPSMQDHKWPCAYLKSLLLESMSCMDDRVEDTGPILPPSKIQILLVL